MYLIEVEVHPGQRLPITRQMASSQPILARHVHEGPGDTGELWYFEQEIEASFYCSLIELNDLFNRPAVVTIEEGELEEYLMDTQAMNTLASSLAA